VALGNYTITAYATPVTLEFDTPDNNYTDGVITVGAHDVAVINVVAHPPSVPSGQTVYINVTAENQGYFSETFEVVVYADRWGGNTHVNIGSETVSLDVGDSTILEFTWDTSGVPCGTYWITAEAVLPEDDNLSDNIARTKVGGIFVPGHKPEANILTLMVPIASAILFIVALGMAAIGFFKILMSVRIKWLLRQHDRSRVQKGQRDVVIPYTRGPSLNRTWDATYQTTKQTFGKTI